MHHFYEANVEADAETSSVDYSYEESIPKPDFQT